MLQTQQYIAVIITLYNFMSFKEAERRKESKYVFMALYHAIILL